MLPNSASFCDSSVHVTATERKTQRSFKNKLIWCLAQDAMWAEMLNSRWIKLTLACPADRGDAEAFLVRNAICRDFEPTQCPSRSPVWQPTASLRFRSVRWEPYCESASVNHTSTRTLAQLSLELLFHFALFFCVRLRRASSKRC